MPMLFRRGEVKSAPALKQPAALPNSQLLSKYVIASLKSGRTFSFGFPVNASFPYWIQETACLYSSQFKRSKRTALAKSPLDLRNSAYSWQSKRNNKMINKIEKRKIICGTLMKTYRQDYVHYNIHLSLSLLLHHSAPFLRVSLSDRTISRYSINYCCGIRLFWLCFLYSNDFSRVCTNMLVRCSCGNRHSEDSIECTKLI